MTGNENLKAYYSIGEVAEMLKVSASLLRFWEKEFPDIIQPVKGSRGRRKYNEKALESVRILHDLIKNKGFTLEGARKHFREGKSELRESDAVLKSLEHLKKGLLSLKEKVG